MRSAISPLTLVPQPYQKFRILLSRVNKYLDKLEKYQGTDWGGDEIKASQIINRTLRVIIPDGSITAIQEEALKAASRIARSKHIRLIFTKF